jgi:hypothetical protein
MANNQEGKMVILPSWVYEPLPYVYGIAGVLSAYNLDSLMGRISGILLITAGIVVGYQRYEYRRFRKQRQERLDWLQEQARKKKAQRQEWLRDQAKTLRDEIENKKNNF